MNKLVLALALLVGCSPTYRITKRNKAKNCPTTVIIVGDLVLASAALAVSALKWNAQKHYESLGYTTLGMGVIFGAHFAEDGCRRGI